MGSPLEFNEFSVGKIYVAIFAGSLNIKFGDQLPECTVWISSQLQISVWDGVERKNKISSLLVLFIH